MGNSAAIAKDRQQFLADKKETEPADRFVKASGRGPASYPTRGAIPIGVAFQHRYIPASEVFERVDIEWWVVCVPHDAVNLRPQAWSDFDLNSETGRAHMIAVAAFWFMYYGLSKTGKDEKTPDARPPYDKRPLTEGMYVERVLSPAAVRAEEVRASSVKAAQQRAIAAAAAAASGGSAAAVAARRGELFMPGLIRAPSSSAIPAQSLQEHAVLDRRHVDETDEVFARVLNLEHMHKLLKDPYEPDAKRTPADDAKYRDQAESLRDNLRRGRREYAALAVPQTETDVSYFRLHLIGENWKQTMMPVKDTPADVDRFVPPTREEWARTCREEYDKVDRMFPDPPDLPPTASREERRRNELKVQQRAFALEAAHSAHVEAKKEEYQYRTGGAVASRFDLVWLALKRALFYHKLSMESPEYLQHPALLCLSPGQLECVKVIHNLDRLVECLRIHCARTSGLNVTAPAARARCSLYSTLNELSPRIVFDARLGIAKYVEETCSVQATYANYRPHPQRVFHFADPSFNFHVVFPRPDCVWRLPVDEAVPWTERVFPFRAIEEEELESLRAQFEKTMKGVVKKNRYLMYTDLMTRHAAQLAKFSQIHREVEGPLALFRWVLEVGRSGVFQPVTSDSVDGVKLWQLFGQEDGGDDDYESDGDDLLDRDDDVDGTLTLSQLAAPPSGNLDEKHGSGRVSAPPRSTVEIVCIDDEPSTQARRAPAPAAAAEGVDTPPGAAAVTGVVPLSQSIPATGGDEKQAPESMAAGQEAEPNAAAAADAGDAPAADADAGAPTAGDEAAAGADHTAVSDGGAVEASQPAASQLAGDAADAPAASQPVGDAAAAPAASQSISQSVGGAVIAQQPAGDAAATVLLPDVSALAADALPSQTDGVVPDAPAPDAADVAEPVPTAADAADATLVAALDGAEVAPAAETAAPSDVADADGTATSADAPAPMPGLELDPTGPPLQPLQERLQQRRLLSDEERAKRDAEFQRTRLVRRREGCNKARREAVGIDSSGSRPWLLHKDDFLSVNPNMSAADRDIRTRRLKLFCELWIAHQLETARVYIKPPPRYTYSYVRKENEREARALKARLEAMLATIGGDKAIARQREEYITAEEFERKRVNHGKFGRLARIIVDRSGVVSEGAQAMIDYLNDVMLAGADNPQRTLNNMRGGSTFGDTTPFMEMMITTNTIPRVTHQSYKNFPLMVLTMRMFNPCYLAPDMTLNLRVTGENSTGKSYIVKLVKAIAVPLSCEVIAHLSTMADLSADTPDISDRLKFVEEAPMSIFVVARGHDKDARALQLWKNKLTSREQTFAVLNYTNGQRGTLKGTVEGGNGWVICMNATNDELEEAMLSRFHTYCMDDVTSMDANPNAVVPADDPDDRHLVGMNMLRYRFMQTLSYVCCKAMVTSTIPRPLMHYARLLVMRILDVAASKGATETRHPRKLERVCMAIEGACIDRAVTQMYLLQQSGTAKAFPADERWDLSHIKRLSPLLVPWTEEIVFHLELFASEFQDRSAAAIGRAILTKYFLVAEENDPTTQDRRLRREITDEKDIALLNGWLTSDAQDMADLLAEHAKCPYEWEKKYGVSIGYHIHRQRTPPDVGKLRWYSVDSERFIVECQGPIDFRLAVVDQAKTLTQTRGGTNANQSLLTLMGGSTVMQRTFSTRHFPYTKHIEGADAEPKVLSFHAAPGLGNGGNAMFCYVARSLLFDKRAHNPVFLAINEVLAHPTKDSDLMLLPYTHDGTSQWRHFRIKADPNAKPLRFPETKRLTQLEREIQQRMFSNFDFGAKGALDAVYDLRWQAFREASERAMADLPALDLTASGLELDEFCFRRRLETTGPKLDLLDSEEHEYLKGATPSRWRKMRAEEQKTFNMPALPNYESLVYLSHEVSMARRGDGAASVDAKTRAEWLQHSFSAPSVPAAAASDLDPMTARLLRSNAMGNRSKSTGAAAGAGAGRGALYRKNHPRAAAAAAAAVYASPVDSPASLAASIASVTGARTRLTGLSAAAAIVAAAAASSSSRPVGQPGGSGTDVRGMNRPPRAHAAAAAAGSVSGRVLTDSQIASAVRLHRPRPVGMTPVSTHAVS